jgi:hypothetical protein
VGLHGLFRLVDSRRGAVISPPTHPLRLCYVISDPALSPELAPQLESTPQSPVFNPSAGLAAARMAIAIAAARPGIRASLSNAVQPMFLKQEVDGVLAQGLGRAFDLNRQHAQLLPRLRPQIDRERALALAARRPLSSGFGFGLRRRIRRRLFLRGSAVPKHVDLASTSLTRADRLGGGRAIYLQAGLRLSEPTWNRYWRSPRLKSKDPRDW